MLSAENLQCEPEENPWDARKELQRSTRTGEHLEHRDGSAAAKCPIPSIAPDVELLRLNEVPNI